MNKNFFWIKLAFCFFAFGLFIFSSFSFAFVSHAQYNYSLMEPIPGFEQASSFPDYILAIYKFGIWTVGISALLMITIGGFMYMTSAGNTSKSGGAKEIIKDALIGLVVALAAYLILYVINPDLIKINLKPLPLGSGGGTGAGVRSSAPQGTRGGGSCQTLPSGNVCSPENLRNTCFGSDAEKMSQICNFESGGGNSLAQSNTDRCKDGSAWSVGLFQINMINSAGSVGCNGKEIFKINGAGPQGNCLDPKVNSKGVGYCQVRDCEVINQSKYNECLSKLQNPTTNIQAACSLYSARRFQPWSTTARTCGIN